MDMVFRLALVVIFGGAVIIGIVAGRSQAPPSAAAVSTPTPTALPAPLPGQVNIVPLQGNNPPAAYTPALLVVHTGDQVTWTNYSASDQTVTADNGAFNSNVLSSGQSFTWKANKTGRFTYSSYLSAGLRGEVDVTP